MPTTPEVVQLKAVSHTGREESLARTFCGTREGLASGWVPRPVGMVLGGPAETDLQGVHPSEAGVLHGQEDGAVLWGQPAAAQEERGAVEGPLQGHQVQGCPGKQTLPLVLAQEALPASLGLWAGEEGDRLSQRVSSEQRVQQQEAALLESGYHVAEGRGWVPEGGHGTVARQQVSHAQAAGGRVCRVPLALGRAILLQLGLDSLQGLRVAVRGCVVQLEQGLGVEQRRNAGIQAAITSQHLYNVHPGAAQVFQGGVHAGLECRGIEKAVEQGVVMQQGPLLGQQLVQLQLQAPIELELAGSSQQLRQALLQGLPGHLGPIQPRHHHL